MRANAPYTALQVVSTVMGQQVHRKIKEIRQPTTIRHVCGARNYAKLLFQATWQHKRSIHSISDVVPLRGNILAYPVGYHIVAPGTLLFALVYLHCNFSWY